MQENLEEEIKNTVEYDKKLDAYVDQHYDLINDYHIARSQSKNAQTGAKVLQIADHIIKSTNISSDFYYDSYKRFMERKMEQFGYKKLGVDKNV